MPKPKTGESKSDFISRCIPYVKKEHPDWEQDKVSAVCYSIWERKGANKMKKERVLLQLCGSILPEDFNGENFSVQEIDKCTLIVGDGVYNTTFFPKEELEKAFHTWEGQPINLDHSENIEDEVGHLENVTFENDRIRAKLVFHEGAPKYNAARSYISGRLNANKIPEVSVGVWVDKYLIEEEERDNYPPTAIFRAENPHGDHMALVSRGACSPDAGCGIGLSEDNANFATVTKIEINWMPNEELEALEKKKLDLKKKILIEKIKLEANND